ncbi:MAG: Gfo/Idh/MocA family oxidoreductase [Armatimonadetes bacterium]|nr:Gfo/Idh/MocA family oxidoreductase [Armatimonadota bacterium]
MPQKVRIGLIGCGGMANAHIRQLQAIPEAQITAITDPSEAAIKRTLERWPALRGKVANCPTHEDLLARADVDAVQIHSPHTLHFQQAMDALAAGKHVLIEKPMVCRTDHARALIERWKASGKVALISYQRHLQEEFRYAREVIQSGGLGQVQYIAALQAQDWLRLARATWRQTQELGGGGQITDSGSHLIDIILWVTGERAAEVHAYQDCLGTPVDINTAAAIKFQSGALGTISVIGNAPSWWEDITFIGSEGAIYIRPPVTDSGQPLHRFDAVGKPVEVGVLGKGSNPDRNFIDAILGRGEVQAPLTCGLAVIELTEAAWRSAESGKPEKVG